MTCPDYLKIRYEWLDSRNPPFTLRDFFTKDQFFPDRFGHFRADAFRTQWNKGRVWMPDETLSLDGDLNFHKLDIFVRHVEGSPLARFDIPEEKLTSDEPEMMEPTEEPVFERSPPPSESLPTDPAPDAGKGELCCLLVCLQNINIRLSAAGRNVNSWSRSG